MVSKEKLLAINKFKESLKQSQKNNLFLANTQKAPNVFSTTNNNILNKAENLYKSAQSSKNYLTENKISNSNINKNSVLKTKSFTEKTANSTLNSANQINNSSSNYATAKDLRSFITNNKSGDNNANYTVDMSGMNNIIQNQTDVQKIIKEISVKLEQSLNSAAQGVY